MKAARFNRCLRKHFMYTKPGFREADVGRTFPDWARTLYEVRGAGITWETNIFELFRSITPNLRRMLRFVQLEDALTAHSDAAVS
jgi:hypothetical protein